VSAPYVLFFTAELTGRVPMEREHSIKLESRMSGLYTLIRT
jgi:hypothetical protein